jgi:hypothetical protein
MGEQTFRPGEKTFAAADAPNGQYSAFFEDDGETGYLYAVDLNRTDNVILDAVQIYNVANVRDRDRPSTLSIEWSTDGLKCALLINSYPHAAFDFASKRGFCRANFPNFRQSEVDAWTSSDHSWSDAAVAWLKSR